MQGAVVVNVRTEEVAKIIGSLRTERSGNIFLVDSDGRILLQNAPYADILPPPFPDTEEGLLTGEKRMLAVSRTLSEQTGWYVFSITPYTVMVGSFNFLRFSFVALLSITVVAVVLATLSSRFLYRPIQSLLRRIGAGQDLDDRDEFLVIDRVYHNTVTEARQLENRAERGERAILEKALRSYIFYQEPSPIVQDALARLQDGPAPSFVLALLAPDISRNSENTHSSVDSWNYVFIVQLARELLELHDINGYVFETEDGIAMLLAQSHTDVNAPLKILGELRDMVAGHLAFTVSLGVSEPHDSWDAIGGAYIEAQAALSYRIARGHNQIFLFGQGDAPEDIALGLPSYCMRLDAMLRMRNEPEALRCIAELTDEMRRHSTLTPNQVINSYLYLLFYTLHTLSNLDRGVYNLLFQEADISELMCCATLDACHQWITVFLAGAFEPWSKAHAPNPPYPAKSRRLKPISPITLTRTLP
ncbi:hypothetical protein LJC63_09525 [Ruminococcaceae bacterium OttesenSCG-928-L11]|nr:hypothetical protein [Ruminococcaceae bacterium OttesenSCG-928-L11]